MKKSINKRHWEKVVQETLEMILPKELDNTTYANGGGYIQLSMATYAKFLLKYREVVENTMPDMISSFDKNPAGFIGRYLDDAGNPAYTLWGKAACIDSKLRMWGQPYFCNHPDEADQICLANV